MYKNTKTFTIKQKEYLYSGKKWVCIFGDKPTGIGPANQIWFSSKEELIAVLEAAGIGPDKYDAIDS